VTTVVIYVDGNFLFKKADVLQVAPTFTKFQIFMHIPWTV